MPNNMRPSMLDPYRSGDRAKLEDAQNQWDLLNAQEEANKLAQENLDVEKQKIKLENQRLDEERENARIIANATRQAEIDRHKNELKIQKKQIEHDKELKYIELCDALGVVYKDIEEFNTWLNALTVEQRNYYQGIVSQYNALVYTDEVKKLEEKLEKHKDELEELEDELNDIEDDEYDNIIKVHGVMQYGKEYEGSIEDIRNLIETNNELIQDAKSVIRTLTILTIGCFIATIFMFSHFWTHIPYIVLGIGAFLDLIFIDRKIRLQNGNKIMSKLVAENENKKSRKTSTRDSLEKQIKQDERKLDKLIKQKSSDVKSNPEYKDLVDKYYDALDILSSNKYRPNKIKFNEFRYNHYNKDMENLFKNLNLNIDRIDTTKVKNTGTIDDYTDYINNILANESISESELDDDTDSLLEEAIERVVDETEVTEEFLENALMIDIDRASKIMEQLEMRGIVSFEEEGYRKVLMTRERWNKLMRQ